MINIQDKYKYLQNSLIWSFFSCKKKQKLDFATTHCNINLNILYLIAIK